jgi:predicted dehydrogenase
MSNRHSRRSFLQSSLYSGIAVWVGDRSLAATGRMPSEQINFGCIGVGGKGESDTADAARFGNIAAICDVDEVTLAKSGAKYSGAQRFADYRIMLERLGKSIDAVTVSTPDHHHGPATSMALQMGKAAYTQKPLTHSIWEARRLAELAREMKVATQMGNQGTAAPKLRENAAHLRAGLIGTIKEVHVWTNRPIWPQGVPRGANAPVPITLNWNEWLGPAPERPYAAGYHSFAWRGWWDFGTGAIGDMACHTVNLPFMALDLRDPISVQAESAGHNRDSYPEWSTIKFEFAKTKHRPAITMHWYDGGKVPEDLLTGLKRNASGSMIIGDKGKLYTPGDYGDQGQWIGVTPSGTPDVPVAKGGHFGEFAEAIRTGKQSVSNFPDYSGPLTETILLGNLAVWTTAKGEGPKIEWDSRRMVAKNMKELDQIVHPVFLNGYKV